MKTYKQFVNEKLNNELTTEDLERMMTKDGELYLSDKGLTTLHNLPEGLIKLYCNNNNLVELPPLPKGLKELYCSINRLVELPPLPEGLIKLSCWSNHLINLPKLPKGLKYLACDDNPNITKYDLPFPSTLTDLNCDDLYGFTNITSYKEWLEHQKFRKDNPDLATLDDIGLL